MDVALSFPLYGLHSIKALEISTPYKKQARSSDPAQAITSDDLTKLHQHRPAHDSDYTHSSSVLGFNKNHSVVVSPLPSLCQVSFCHLFISSSIPFMLSCDANENSWLHVTPLILCFFPLFSFSAVLFSVTVVIFSYLPQCLLWDEVIQNVSGISSWHCTFNLHPISKTLCLGH